MISFAFAIVFCCCTFGTTFALTITRDGFYDTKYNHLDIERVLNNKRLVNYYGQCLLGEGPCTPQGAEFKRILPEALKTNCIRCTDKQKVTAYLAIRRLKKEYPKIWQQLQAVWDPSGELVSLFINNVETSSNLEGITGIGNNAQQEQETDVSNNQVPPNLFNRFGGDTENTDNEINTSQKAPAPYTLPLQSASEPATSIQVISNIQKISNTSTNTSTNTSISTSSTSTSTNKPPQIIQESPSTTTQRLYTTRTTITEFNNYRTSLRPNLVPILPRPIDLGKITANVFAQVADVGSKVIRTGARIADMVLSGVQASVRPIFINNNNNNRDQQ